MDYIGVVESNGEKSNMEHIDDTNSADEDTGDDGNHTVEKEANLEDMDNDDVDDSSDSEDDEEGEAEIKLLEASLQENPYDYASHLTLITKLQTMGDKYFDRLKLAREIMSSKYPLSPDLWLAWLRDEISLANTLAERELVIKLFERAVRDYTSIDVWLEYVQFSIGNMGRVENATNIIRELFERALTAVGLHITKGAVIWEAFREFENVLVSMIDSSDEQARKQQINRVGALFRRQLACPLLDMEKTYEEYESWRASDGLEADLDDNIVNSSYERALAQLNLRLAFEEKLVSAQGEAELLDAYKGYLLFEKQNGDPARVNLLYERAVVELSLEVSLWLEFITYIENTIKLESVLSVVYDRATRNVPWCVTIWKNWLRSYEKWDKSLTEIQALLEKALTAGFSTAEEYRTIWLTYLEYLRRRTDTNSSEKVKLLEILRSTFNRACEYLAKGFGLEGDPQCVILQYWARTEAIHADSMDKARTLWADILSQGHSAAAASWLEYISLERCYGDTKHLRKLYQRALASVKDWPESIINAWIDFERDEGNLEQLEVCEAKTKEKLEKITEERKKTQAPSHKPISPVSTRRTTKRKPDDRGKWKNLGESSEKQAKLKVDPRPSKLKGNTSKPADKITPPIGYAPSEVESKPKPKIAPPPGFKPPEDEQMEEDHPNEVDERITVFISNLDYSATEEEVRDSLRPAGPITQFKMVRDFKGRSKGYCYVQLGSTEAVEEALKLDRTPVNGRPMFVSRCDPNKTTRGTVFKYSAGLEKNKLFVKGLPLIMTKEQLEEVFKPYGTLREARLVTYRNGHSKGIAYVEFENEGDASKALLATNGTTIDGKILDVALSQPPERKKGSADEDVLHIKSLGGTSTSRTSTNAPKTMLSMIPRNVKLTSKNETKKEVIGNVSHKESMSNADFRNMLLQNKK